MATGGNGANVVLNCLSGSLLQASIGCLAYYGRFIHIGKFDLEENGVIGMQVFLKSTSFFAVNLENIFTVPDEDKEELKDLVCQGLQKVSVRPLARKVVDHQDIGIILEYIRYLQLIVCDF